MFTKYCDIFLVVPPLTCNIIPVVSSHILSFLFYYLLYVLVNKKGVNLENTGHPEEILRVSYQRIWKIMEIFTAPKESIYTPRLNLGMDTSPVYSSCSGKTGFAIFSVLRIVKLVMMNLAKSVCCSAPDSFLFSLKLFFHQFGLCSICRRCMSKILDCCVFAYKPDKGEEIPDCVYKHQNLIICRI